MICLHQSLLSLSLSMSNSHPLSPQSSCPPLDHEGNSRPDFCFEFSAIWESSVRNSHPRLKFMSCDVTSLQQCGFWINRAHVFILKWTVNRRKKSHLQIPEPVCGWQSIWIRWSGAAGVKSCEKERETCGGAFTSLRNLAVPRWGAAVRPSEAASDTLSVGSCWWKQTLHHWRRNALFGLIVSSQLDAWTGSTMNKPVAVWWARYKPHHYVFSVESWSWAMVLQVGFLGWNESMSVGERLMGEKNGKLREWAEQHTGP